MKFNIEISDTALLLVAAVALVYLAITRDGKTVTEELSSFADQFHIAGWPGHLPTTTTIDSD